LGSTILASCLRIRDEYILLQKKEDVYSLPCVSVKDTETIEMALHEFFQESGWSIAVGGLRYLVEEIVKGNKNLHLVFKITVMKEGELSRGLQYFHLNDVSKLNTRPAILFGKILADLKMLDVDGCTTLVSW
jgi:hypothetical protein